MKKEVCKILYIFCCLLFIWAINGCRKESGGKVTLRMYNYRDATLPEAANWDMLEEAFLKDHSNIKLEIEEGFNDPFHQKLQAMAVSGDIPDLIYLWPGKKTAYITSRGVIKDLRPYLDGHEDEFQDIALSPQGPNGEIYELPQTLTACHIMYVNTTLLEELGLTFPETYMELLAQGEIIRAAGYIPISMANKDSWVMQSCLLSTLAERAGGMEWYNNAINGNNASFADPEFIYALQIIKSLYDANMFSPGINQNEYEKAVNDFINDKAVYYIDGAWKIRALKISLSKDKLDAIDFRTFPDIPNQKGKSGSTAAVPGAGFGMNVKLKGAKADAAWEWIWFYSGPVGSKINQKNGLFPAYKLPPLETQDPLVIRLNEFIISSPMGYVLDNKLDAEGIQEILQPDIQAVMFGKITPEEAALRYEGWVKNNDSARRLNKL